MEKLKKSIIKYFIIFAFTLSVVESILSSLLDNFMEKIVGKAAAIIILVIYFLLSIMIFVIFSIWFAKVVGKKIVNETNRQLNERNGLYANIVHDLKTPMTLILGFSKALKDGRVKEEEQVEIIDTIYLTSRKMDELVDLLFQYTKLSTNEYLFHIEKIDICRIIRECVVSNYEKFEEKQMELIIDIPEESIIKEVDNLEFSRAINNVLVNAFKHNEIGSKILIRLAKDKQCVRIIIGDDGEDILPDVEEQIFEPFICGDESRNSKGGSGLGLAITKKIIEKHMGRIFIERNMNDYTKCFVIELK